MSSSVSKYFELLESGGYVTNSTSKPVEPFPSDPIVEAVKNKFTQRSVKGIKTYGTTLEENQDSFYNWLNHLQEELMDAILYIEKIKKIR